MGNCGNAIKNCVVVLDTKVLHESNANLVVLNAIEIFRPLTIRSKLWETAAAYCAHITFWCFTHLDTVLHESSTNQVVDLMEIFVH